MVFAGASCRERSRFPGAPVILISIDTLRVDHVPAYGYRGVATPALDELAKDSIVFENAWSHVPLTLPSHATILTGLLPPRNGVRDNTGYRLSGNDMTLPEALSARGYATGAAVSSVVLSKTTGIARGFTFYDDRIDALEPGVSLGSVQRAGMETEKIAEDWIARHAGAPFFFFLHLYEPHAPYEPPEPFASRYRERPYDGEIAAADAVVGELFSFLRARGLYDGAVVVLLSDHGEGLGDHGEDEHGLFLYRETLRVPLMIKLPGRRRAGTRASSPVGLVDVFPTIAGVAEAPMPAGGAAGVSLLEARTSPDERPIYGETLFPRYHFGWSDLASLATERFQYIHGPSPELYDLAADPEERRNLAEARPPAFRKLRAELLAMPRPRIPPGPADPERLRRLASLGYVGAASPPEDARALPNPRDRLGAVHQLKNALRAYKERRFQEALRLFSELLADNPEMADAWGAVAEIHHKLGRDGEALEALSRQDRLLPGSPHILLSFANEYLDLGRFADARLYAERALTVVDSPDAHEMLARIALADRDLEGAEREARLALKDHAGRNLSEWILAQVARQRGDLPEALRLVEEVIVRTRSRRLPEMSNVHYLRGDVLARLHRDSEAAEEFASEIALFPENTAAWTGLAFLYASQGRSREARATLEQLVATSATPRAFRAAAETFRILGDARRAAALDARANPARPPAVPPASP